MDKKGNNLHSSKERDKHIKDLREDIEKDRIIYFDNKLEIVDNVINEKEEDKAANLNKKKDKVGSISIMKKSNIINSNNNINTNNSEYFSKLNSKINSKLNKLSHKDNNKEDNENNAIKISPNTIYNEESSSNLNIKNEFSNNNNDLSLSLKDSTIINSENIYSSTSNRINNSTNFNYNNNNPNTNNNKIDSLTNIRVKETFLIMILLLSSLFNISVLSFFYLIKSFYFIFNYGKENLNTKRVFLIVLLIYSILVTFTKTIFFICFKVDLLNVVESSVIWFNSFGIYTNLDFESVFFTFSTDISIIIVNSIILILYKKSIKKAQIRIDLKSDIENEGKEILSENTYKEIMNLYKVRNDVGDINKNNDKCDNITNDINKHNNDKDNENSKGMNNNNNNNNFNDSTDTNNNKPSKSCNNDNRRINSTLNPNESTFSIINSSDINLNYFEELIIKKLPINFFYNLVYLKYKFLLYMVVSFIIFSLAFKSSFTNILLLFIAYLLIISDNYKTKNNIIKFLRILYLLKLITVFIFNLKILKEKIFTDEFYLSCGFVFYSKSNEKNVSNYNKLSNLNISGINGINSKDLVNYTSNVNEYYLCLIDLLLSIAIFILVSNFIYYFDLNYKRYSIQFSDNVGNENISKFYQYNTSNHSFKNDRRFDDKETEESKYKKTGLFNFDEESNNRKVLEEIEEVDSELQSEIGSQKRIESFDVEDLKEKNNILNMIVEDPLMKVKEKNIAILSSINKADNADIEYKEISNDNYSDKNKDIEVNIDLSGVSINNKKDNNNKQENADNEDICLKNKENKKNNSSSNEANSKNLENTSSYSLPDVDDIKNIIKEKYNKTLHCYLSFILILKEYFNEILINLESYLTILRLTRVIVTVLLLISENYFIYPVMFWLFISLRIKILSNKFIAITQYFVILFSSVLLLTISIANITSFSLLAKIDLNFKLKGNLGLNKNDFLVSFSSIILLNALIVSCVFLCKKIQKEIRRRGIKVYGSINKNFHKSNSNSNNNNNSNTVSNTTSTDDLLLRNSIQENKKMIIEELSVFEYSLLFLDIHIDKVSVVILFFICFQNVNAIHLILTCMFIFQITQINKMCGIISKLIVLLEIMIFICYTWNFVKIFFIENETFIELSKLILTDNLESNCLSTKLLILYMIFNIQLNHYQSSTYKVDFINQNLSVENYITMRLKNYTKLSKIVFFFTVLITGLYCWLIIVLLFIIITLKYNCTFLLKLSLLLLIIYQFCHISLSKKLVVVKKPNNISNEQLLQTLNKKIISVISNKGCLKVLCTLSIIYFSFITIIVYSFQFYKFKILFEQEYKQQVFWYLLFKNIKIIGFEVYSNNMLFKKLSPHFLANILIVLLKHEIDSIIKYYEEKKHRCNSNRQDERGVGESRVYSNLSIESNNYYNSLGNKLSSTNFNNTIKLNKLNSKRKISSEIINNEKSERNEIKDLTFMLIKIDYFYYYFLNIVNWVCKKYYIVIIITISLMIVNVELSFVMFIYYIGSFYYFIKHFGIIVNYRNKTKPCKFNCKQNIIILFFTISIFILVSELIKLFIENQKHQYELIKCRYNLVSFCMITGFITIILKMAYYIFDIVHENKSEYFQLVSYDIQRIISSGSYLLGVYCDSNSNSLLFELKNHILIQILLILDQYFLKLQVIVEAKVVKIKGKLKKNSYILKLKSTYKIEKHKAILTEENNENDIIETNENNNQNDFEESVSGVEDHKSFKANNIEPTRDSIPFTKKISNITKNINETNQLNNNSKKNFKRLNSSKKKQTTASIANILNILHQITPLQRTNSNNTSNNNNLNAFSSQRSTERRKTIIHKTKLEFAKQKQLVLSSFEDNQFNSIKSHYSNQLLNTVNIEINNTNNYISSNYNNEELNNNNFPYHLDYLNNTNTLYINNENNLLIKFLLSFRNFTLTRNLNSNICIKNNTYDLLYLFKLLCENTLFFMIIYLGILRLNLLSLIYFILVIIYYNYSGENEDTEDLANSGIGDHIRNNENDGNAEIESNEFYDKAEHNNEEHFDNRNNGKYNKQGYSKRVINSIGGVSDSRNNTYFISDNTSGDYVGISNKKKKINDQYTLLFKLMRVLVFIIIFQFFCLVANFSSSIDPKKNIEVGNDIYSVLHLPIITSIKFFSEDYSLAYFLGFSFTKYDLENLGIDMIILVFMVFYLDMFSLTIYEKVKRSKISEYMISQNKELFNAIFKISKQEYSEITKAFETNFNLLSKHLVELRRRLLERKKKEIQLLKKMKDNKDKDKDKDNENLMNTHTPSNTNTIDINKEICSNYYNNNDNNDLYESQNNYFHVNSESFQITVSNFLSKVIRDLIYFNFHSIILLLVIFFSVNDYSLISLCYILFTCYFTNLSKNLILNRKYPILQGMKFLRLFIFIDLLIQILFQYPKIGDNSIIIMMTIGIYKVFNDLKIDLLMLKLMLFKATTLWLISILIQLYDTRHFKESFLSYIILKKKDEYKSGLLYTFYYNNKRLTQFEQTMANRKEIETVLEILQIQLKEWESNFTNKISNITNTSNNISNINNINNELISNTSSNLINLKINRTHSVNSISQNTEINRRLSSSQPLNIKHCNTTSNLPSNNMNNIKSPIFEITEEPTEEDNNTLNIIDNEKADIQEIKKKITSSKNIYKTYFESISENFKLKLKEELNSYFTTSPLTWLMLYIKKVSFSYKLTNSKNKKSLEYLLTLGINALKSNYELRLEEFAELFANEYLKIYYKYFLLEKNYDDSYESFNYFKNRFESFLESFNLANEIDSLYKYKKSLKIKNKKREMTINNTKNMHNHEKENNEDIENHRNNNNNEKIINNRDSINDNAENNDLNEIKIIDDNIISSSNTNNNNADINYNDNDYYEDYEENNSLDNSLTDEELLEKTINSFSSYNYSSSNSSYIDSDINNDELQEKTIKEINSLSIIKNKRKVLFLKLSTNKFISKYETFTYKILKVFKYSLYYVFENFFLICYLFMILNHMIYACMISLVWPFVVFGFALFENPKPGRRFWNLALVYCIIVVIFKFLLQLKLQKIIGLFSPDFKDEYKIGIKIFTDCYKTKYKEAKDTCVRNSDEFIDYILFDLLLLFSLLILQFINISKGTWVYRESEIESIEEAIDRVYSIKYKNEKKRDEYITNKLSKREKSKFLYQIKKKLKDIDKEGCLSNYYKNLFPKLRNQKPGKDLFAYYTVTMMFIVFYLILFYSDLDRNLIFQDPEVSLKMNQFSGSMVLVVFLYVFLIFLDRIIYSSVIRAQPTFNKMYFNKHTGEKYSNSNNNNNNNINIINQDTNQESNQINDASSNIIKRPTNSNFNNLNSPITNDYEEIYLQYEKRNNPLIYKYLLTMSILIFSHLFIFFFLPFRGNYNLNFSIYCKKTDFSSSTSHSDSSAYNSQNSSETTTTTMCNNFNDNYKLVIFYIMHIFYFVFSAQQIRYGLLDMKKTSILMRDDNLLNYAVFKIYKAIPFLYELKLLIDWTFSSTALDIFQWIKLENVHDMLFIAKCYYKSYMAKVLGEKITKIEKLIFGASFLILILACLLGPIWLFSSLNPTNETNNVLSGKLSLSINIKNDNSSVLNFKLFESNMIMNMELISSDDFKQEGFLSNVETTNFPLNQIQKIKFNNIPNQEWNIPQMHMEFLIKNILDEKSTVEITLDNQFERKLPNDAYIATGNSTLVLDETHRNQLSDMVRCYDTSYMRFEGLLNNAIRLTASSKSRPITLNRNKITVFLYYICSDTTDSFFIVSDSPLKYKGEIIADSQKIPSQIDLIENNGINIITFSDKVSPTTSSYNILTFYISFIYIIGQVIRSFTSSEAERIIFTEMPETSGLINLCEGIKISRFQKKYKREEHLYYIMIDLMRSPEILKSLTKSSIIWLNEKNKYSNLGLKLGYDKIFEE